MIHGNDYNAKTAESAVIGAILQDETALPRLLPLVRPEQFSIATYRTLYEYLIGMNQRGMVIDIVSVVESMPVDQLARIGGETVLIKCCDSVIRFENAEHYAVAIVDKWKTRQLAEAIQSAQAVLGKGDREEAIAKIQDVVIKINSEGDSAKFASVGSLMLAWYERLEAVMANPRLADELYLKTGFYDFDKAFGGLSIGTNVLAARPKMGKTSYALCEAYQVAKSGKTVLFLSLEMPKEQLIRRFAALVSGVDSTRLDYAQLIDGELATVAQCLDESQSLDIHFLDAPNEVTELVARLEEWRLVNGRSPDLVVIDYLGRLRAKGVAPDEYSQMGHISKLLSEYFTTKIKRPCRLLHQLSRAVEQRTDKRPMASDLRGNGGIEQDATQITMLYRHGYYCPEQDDGTCEVITVANRENPTGTIKLLWVPETTRFLNMHQHGYS